MPLNVLLLLALGLLATGSGAARLPLGDERFRLGMFRAEVDSAVAVRGLAVLSNGSAHLVCASDDPRAEYEQYSFFHPPHGPDRLWKVTVGYRLEATRADLDSVLEALERTLGPPLEDTGPGTGVTDLAGQAVPVAARRVTWADPLTAVLLGARWSDAPDRRADRMMVTWTDRKIQRLIEARRKKEKSGQ